MRLLFLFTLLTILVACTSSPSPVLPPKALEPIKNSLAAERLWSQRIGRGAGDNYLRLEPIIDGDTIYSVDYLGNVYSYNIRKLTENWVMQLGAGGSSPLYKDGSHLYVGTSEGQVIALSTAEGKVLWRSQLNSEVLAAPVAGNGVVVARCVNGDVVALRQDNGKQLWKVEERTPPLTLRGTSTPLIYKDLLIVAFDNGKLKAFALRSGRQIWEAVVSVPRGRSDLERIVDLDTSPVIVDDVIYSVAYQGKLVAIQIGSGQLLWQRDVDSYLDITVDAYRIYLIDSGGLVWALDRANGATLWKQDALLRRGLTAPRLADDYLVLGDYNGFVHWLRRDNGKLEARIRLSSFDYRNPGLDESDAELFPKANNIMARPLVLGNKLIVTDRYGHTEAFEITKR